MQNRQRAPASITPLIPLEKRDTLVERAFAAIEESIVRGTISPGTWLYENPLARQLGISRGPVREAIRRLEERGLVERLPFKGVRVVELSVQEILDLSLIREHVEGLAARLAAAHIDAAEARTLSLLLRKHERSNEQQGFSEYFQPVGDLDFHFRIVKAAASERLLRLFVREIYHPLRVYRYRSSTLGRTKAALDEHRSIVLAIRDRDADAAERLMRAHIANSRTRLISALDTNEDSLPPAAARKRSASSNGRKARSLRRK